MKALKSIRRPKFQSTLPRRERRVPLSEVYEDLEISIHAPAKGATLAFILTSNLREFQSTLPRRERPKASAEIEAANQFQSTLPRRERLEVTFICHPTKYIFQSTLPRRERQCLLIFSRFKKLFQSTLPRRERQDSGFRTHTGN